MKNTYRVCAQNQNDQSLCHFEVEEANLVFAAITGLADLANAEPEESFELVSVSKKTEKNS